MPFRLVVDIDGVLSDFAGAFRQLAAELHSTIALRSDGNAAASDDSDVGKRASVARRDSRPNPLGEKGEPLSAADRQQIWREIKETSNFWTTLEPIEPFAIGRLDQLARDHGWEVTFLTQRPATRGESVQRQTQRWLAAQGFELPSVIVSTGDRAQLVAHLRADVVVDDLVENCVEASSASNAAVMLVWRSDAAVPADAARHGITVVRQFSECLDMLETLSHGMAPETQGHHGWARMPTARTRSQTRAARLLARLLWRVGLS